MTSSSRPGSRGASRTGRLAAVLLAAVTTLLLLVPWLTTTAQEVRPLRLALLDQTFSVSAGDMISMTFAVEGDVPTALLPTTTTTAPPTTTTTTTPIRTTGADRQPLPTTSTTGTSTTTTVPPTTSAPEPAVNADMIVVAYPRLTSRSQIADALAGDVSGDPEDGVLVPSLQDQLRVRGRGDNRKVRLDVSVPVAVGEPSQENDLGLFEPGLYPIRIAIRIDETTIGEYFTLVRLLPAVPPPGVRLAVVAGAIDDDPLDELRSIADLGRGSAPLSVIIPPSTLQSASLLRPRLVERLAEALRGDEAVSLPSDVIDPSSAATADGLDEVFIDGLADGEDTHISLLPETPPRRTAWPLLDELSEAGADLLSQVGVRLFIADEDYVTGRVEPPERPLPGQQISVPVGDRNLGALVVDPDVARLVGAPSNGRNAFQQALELFATLTLDEVTLGGRGMLLAVDGFGTPDRAVIDALSILVDESPDAAFVTLSALPGFADVDTDVQLDLPTEAGIDLSERVDLINRSRLDLADTDSMLPDDDPRPAKWAATLDELLTTKVDDAEVAAAISTMTTESRLIRASIVPPEPFRFTLTGRNSEVRLRIGNTSNTTLQVMIVPSSARIEFPDGPQIVDVPPGDDPAVVTIRVRARSNGTSAVAMTLTTPAGRPLGEPVILTARVNSLTGLSQVLTGGALLVLATWWFTHLRQQRRERRSLPRRGRKLAPESHDLVSPDAAEALAESPAERGDEPGG